MRTIAMTRVIIRFKRNIQISETGSPLLLRLIRIHDLPAVEKEDDNIDAASKKKKLVDLMPANA